MALPILPSNGFISRLLQQTTQAPVTNNSNTNEKSSAKTDQTSISSEAREANKSTGNHQLESKLIELYNQKGQGKS